MKKILVFLFILFNISNVTNADETLPKKHNAADKRNVAAKQNIAVKQTDNDSFVVFENIPYVTNGSAFQQLDLYLPKDAKTAAKPVPVVIVIHGGGWTNGSKDLKKFVEWSRFYAENGYAVANINYRLRPDFVMPAQIHDVKSAVRWLRANAKKYNLDINHFASFGSSAGGHLAATLGTSAHVKEFDQGEHLDQSSAVQATVDFCGPSDFFTFRTEKKDKKAKIFAVTLFGKNAENKDVIKKSSPLQTVTSKAAPFLIVHAKDDKTVPIQQGKSLHETLQKAGVESHFIELTSGGHGSPQFNNAETKKQIIDFLNKHLR
ncbi:MAG: alpha/beta hydrolase [Planctomycetaceae bacterium]|jgi:acetyl esterase/lipase|nr:alpha/beta hydrolase [Planctomycetaceae bacterium]